MFEKITVLEAKDLIEENVGNEKFVILDLRTPNEFSTGHLERAMNIDFYNENFKTNLDKLDKTKTYLIYCRSGYRTGLAMEILKELKFQVVYDMGGIMAWIDEALPVAR